MLADKPTDIPRARPDGSPLKPITEVLLERRATNKFTDEEVPAEVLEAVLRLGAQAPSGYNFQPWRFVVVRDADARRRLQQVAFNQPKVAQAPVVSDTKFTSTSTSPSEISPPVQTLRTRATGPQKPLGPT